MARDKHHIFSARTTEEGLRMLNGLKAERGVGWDELIIVAVNGQYGVDVPMPPKAKRPKARKAEAKKGDAQPETGELR